jgi:hypothetical protein
MGLGALVNGKVDCVAADIPRQTFRPETGGAKLARNTAKTAREIGKSNDSHRASNRRRGKTPSFLERCISYKIMNAPLKPGTRSAETELARLEIMRLPLAAVLKHSFD